MRQEYESEMEELRKKMASEKETKAKMQSEIEKMKLEYEEKMKSLEERVQTAKLQRGLDHQVRAFIINSIQFKKYLFHQFLSRILL